MSGLVCDGLQKPGRRVCSYLAEDGKPFGIARKGVCEKICISHGRYGNVTGEQRGEIIKARKPVRK